MLIEWHGLTTSRVMPSNVFAGRQGDALPVAACRNRHGFGGDEWRCVRDFGAHAVDHPVVQNVVLIVRAPLDEPAEARDPQFVARRCGVQHRIGNTGLAKQAELRPVELLAAEVRRINRVRIDQHRVDAGAPQHRGRGGAGKPAADDRNVRVPHGGLLSRTHLCGQEA